MKARRRHIPFGENVDPSAFDYTLLNHLYIHDDGNDVIDFGGFQNKTESKHEVQELLRNRSFIGSSVASGVQAAAAASALAAANASVTGAALLHLQGDDAPLPGVSGMPTHPARRDVSRLVSVEATEAHIWLVTQTSEDRPPYARMFDSADALLAYLTKHGMEIPTRGQKRKMSRHSSMQMQYPGSPTTATSVGTGGKEFDVPFPMPQSRREQGPLPTAKWIDIQAKPNDPDTNAMLRQLLSHFPVDEATIDNCLYLTPHDYIDTTHLTSRTASYAFFVLTCTPLEGLDYAAGGSQEGKKGTHRGLSARQRLRRRFSREQREEAAETGGVPAAGTTGPATNEAGNTKGVMEMRFEAVRLELPRTAVPDPVPVAIVAFADWVITIHEKPFAEMDDLLRIIQLHCSPRASSGLPGPAGVTAVPASPVFASRASGMQTSSVPQEPFTSAFVFTNLLQISIGHHLDSVALAQAVDELGDVVFDVKETDKEQDKVLQRITAARRCFGECGADVTRREHIVATLLQPNLAHNFLLRDPWTRERLLNAQAHMRYVQHELSDCRDTVAVSNWYHNVALQWILLRRGNRALRQLLQLTEMANIMYPVITVQTLYSINVPVPFDAEGDPPNESLIPFFVLAAVIIVYTLLCSRALYRMFKRTPFRTKLLA